MSPGQCRSSSPSRWTTRRTAPSRSSHYRAGLTGLVEGLPRDVEVTIITTTPQPRMVVRPTADRTQILRAITGFAPEQRRPRFTEALVEFSERSARSAGPPGRSMRAGADHALDDSGRAEQLSAGRSHQGRQFLSGAPRPRQRDRHVHAHGPGDAGNDRCLLFRASIAMPGRQGDERPLPVACGLEPPGDAAAGVGTSTSAVAAGVLEINQVRGRLERTPGGELQNPRIELARPGLDGVVTIDGHLRRETVLRPSLQVVTNRGGAVPRARTLLKSSASAFPRSWSGTSCGSARERHPRRRCPCPRQSSRSGRPGRCPASRSGLTAPRPTSMLSARPAAPRPGNASRESFWLKPARTCRTDLAHLGRGRSRTGAACADSAGVCSGADQPQQQRVAATAAVVPQHGRRSPLLVTSRSRSPSLSMSPAARPRPDLGHANPGPALGPDLRIRRSVVVPEQQVALL